MSDASVVGVGAVFPTKSLKLRDTIVRAIAESAGIVPVGKRVNEGVSRALYAPATTRTIINCSSEKILERLGNPDVVMTLTVKDPRAASLIAKSVMENAEYSVRVVDSAEVELGIPKGFMYFLLSDNFVPILFWPATPTTADMKGIASPEEWSYGS